MISFTESQEKKKCYLSLNIQDVLTPRQPFRVTLNNIVMINISCVTQVAQISIGIYLRLKISTGLLEHSVIPCPVDE